MEGGKISVCMIRLHANKIFQIKIKNIFFRIKISASADGRRDRFHQMPFALKKITDILKRNRYFEGVPKDTDRGIFMNKHSVFSAILLLLLFCSCRKDSDVVKKTNSCNLLSTLENTVQEDSLAKLENTDKNEVLWIRSLLQSWVKWGFRKKLFAALKDKVPDTLPDYSLLLETSGGGWGPLYKGFFLADKIYYFHIDKDEIRIFSVLPPDKDFFKEKERLVKEIFSEKTFYGDISVMASDAPVYAITAVQGNNLKTLLINFVAFPKYRDIKGHPTRQNKFDPILNSIDNFCGDIVTQAPWTKKQKDLTVQ